jgi:hypothetical protein
VKIVTKDYEKEGIPTKKKKKGFYACATTDLYTFHIHRAEQKETQEQP